MPLSLFYDPGPEILTVTITGTVRAPDLDDFLASLAKSDRMTLAVATVWDMNGFDFENATSDMFETIIERRRRYPGRRNAPLALVVASDLGFGMCRMYQIMSEVHGAAAEGTINVFRDFAAAHDWLRGASTLPG